jgi:hypothetical protein
MAFYIIIIIIIIISSSSSSSRGSIEEPVLWKLSLVILLTSFKYFLCSQPFINL